MTRDDLNRFRTLDIDFEAIGLMEPGVPQAPYFCTPVGAEYVGRLGCDGVHFILLPGDERVFCVEPSMGDIGTFVLPVAADLRELLSFVLYCRDANPLSQIFWMEEGQFRGLLEENAASCDPNLSAPKDAALAAIGAAFGLSPVDPYEKIKALQADFDPGVLEFSDEYYDVLGLER